MPARFGRPHRVSEHKICLTFDCLRGVKMSLRVPYLCLEVFQVYRLAGVYIINELLCRSLQFDFPTMS